MATSKKKIFVWVLGILLIIGGLGALPRGIGGLFMMLAGALVLPPVRAFIQEKWKFPMTTGRTAIAVIVLMVLGAATTKPEQQVVTAPVQVTQNASSAIAEAPVPVEVPPVPKTPEEKIKAVVADQLQGTTNMKQQRLRGVTVKPFKSGYEVAVDFNADDNFSNSWIRGQIESRMTDVYRALLTQDLGVEVAEINAYFPLRDKYGKDVDGRVYATLLDKEEASKVNWETPDTVLEAKILPQVWTLVLLHPAIND